MDFSDKEKIWSSYITTQFGDAHPRAHLQREYATQHRYFRKNYLPFFPKNKDAKVLDLACGMGHFLYALKKEGYTDSLGVDLSDEEVALCKEQGFRVIRSDIFAFLSDKREMYDVIIFNDIIEHLSKDDIFRALSLIRSALKGGGKVFIKTPNMDNFITAAGGRYIDITHEIGFSEQSMRQTCRLAGFSRIAIHGVNIYVFYENPLNYIAWACSGILDFVMWGLVYMYGRTTAHIFSKDILAICEK